MTAAINPEPGTENFNQNSFRIDIWLNIFHENLNLSLLIMNFSRYFCGLKIKMNDAARTASRITQTDTPFDEKKFEIINFIY